MKHKTIYDELAHADRNYENYLVINWCFHSICNFKCTYCPKSLHDGKVQGPDLEIVLKASDRIINQSPKNKFFFEFTGGEITYYRKFTELMKELKTRGVETGIISNGSRELQWWEEHLHLIDHICLSFHSEQGDMEHFFQVVALLNKTVTTHVNIMILPEKFNELYSFTKKLAAEIDGISISMQPLLENMGGKMYDYSEAQMAILNQSNLPWKENLKYFSAPNKVNKVYRGEMLKKLKGNFLASTNSPELISAGENSWFNWECMIGIENIVIDKDGTMYRGWCKQGGKIGSIFENFTLPQAPVRCLAPKCYCGLDIMATKKIYPQVLA